MAIAQDGSGNIAVQVDGSNNRVTVTRGAARLTLLQRHKRRREPRKHLDLLDPYSRAIDLVGRDDDLGALEAWLASSRPIGVRCLTGRAGSSRTRRELKLCERAEGEDWFASYVAYDELMASQQRQHLVGWRWPQPTLIVVDYAAASTRVLRRWLEQLAKHQGAGSTPQGAAVARTAIGPGRPHRTTIRIAWRDDHDIPLRAIDVHGDASLGCRIQA